MLVGKNYKVESDALNVTVYKKHVSKKTKKETWRAEGYFFNIKNALEFLVDLEVAKTGLRDLVAVTRKQGELYKLIQSLKPITKTATA